MLRPWSSPRGVRHAIRSRILGFREGRHFVDFSTIVGAASFPGPSPELSGSDFLDFLATRRPPRRPKHYFSYLLACACHAFQGGAGSSRAPTFLHRPGTQEAQKRLFLLFGGYHFGHLGAKWRPPGPNFSVFLSFWGSAAGPRKRSEKRAPQGGRTCDPLTYMHIS